MTIQITLPQPTITIILNEDVTLRRKYRFVSWKHYFNSEAERDMYVRFYDVMKKIPKNHRGLYYFYDENDVLLYIGRTINTRQRLEQHFYGSGNSSYFAHLIRKVELIYVPDITDQEIYEAYAIRELNPIHNKAKR